MDANRVPQLDGLRGTAIALVILFHYGPLFKAGHILDAIALRGWVGVDLFFVMSGFLIGGIVIANKNADNLFSVFYARRVLRIFPLYYMVLAAVWTAIWMGLVQHLESDNVFIYLAYSQNIFVAFSHDYGMLPLQPTWSLAVEEHFYLVLPLLVFILPRRFLIYPLIAGVIIATACRVAAYLVPFEYPRDFAYFFTICRIDELFYGVLLAAIVRDERVRRKITKNRIWFYALAVALGAAFLILSHFDAQFSEWALNADNDSGSGRVLTSTIGLTLLGPMFLCVVILSVLHEGSWLSILMKFGPLRWIGVRTYAVYLFHMPALFLVYHLSRHFGHAGMTIPIFALALTLVSASLSWALIEAPLMKVGHRYKYSRRPDAALVAEPAQA